MPREVVKDFLKNPEHQGNIRRLSLHSALPRFDVAVEERLDQVGLHKFVYYRRLWFCCECGACVNGGVAGRTFPKRLGRVCANLLTKHDRYVGPAGLHNPYGSP